MTASSSAYVDKPRRSASDSSLGPAKRVTARIPTRVRPTPRRPTRPPEDDQVFRTSITLYTLYYVSAPFRPMPRHYCSARSNPGQVRRKCFRADHRPIERNGIAIRKNCGRTRASGGKPRIAAWRTFGRNKSLDCNCLRHSAFNPRSDMRVNCRSRIRHSAAITRADVPF